MGLWVHSQCLEGTGESDKHASQCTEIQVAVLGTPKILTTERTKQAFAD